MKLDPILIEAMSGHSFSPANSVEEERANELTLQRSQLGKQVLLRPESVAIRDEPIGGPDAGHPVTVRIYTPAGAKQNRAALVFAHGGGWATGSIEGTDPVCGNLAADADIVVVSVEYRLAPENPFPAGIEDYYHAVRWVFDNAGALGVDASRIAVGGESAGGNLAAVACMMARDRKGPRIAKQLLWAPALDLSFSGPATAEFRKLFPIIAGVGAKMLPRYLPAGTAVDHPYVSPLLANDLSSLPPASLFACEVDPLRDDCRRYAEKLQAAGGTATWRIFPGLLHGTQSLTGVLPIARQWHAECVRELRAL